ncbi:UNKNOWN [Stylonychia lemnae]|uniref:Uncharacterized protein n=1 Tax=Stylonychia lemnae TaxID=5949 RepID=A0A078AFF8_STYLE|nr:UNKNOWN [Stylonychia lemnae]|eukprot:CDW80984.1 UNKNOWN [Stylonychia lemnae]
MLSKDLLAMESIQNVNQTPDEYLMETIPSQISPIKTQNKKQPLSMDRINSKTTTQATVVGLHHKPISQGIQNNFYSSVGQSGGIQQQMMNSSISQSILGPGYKMMGTIQGSGNAGSMS